MSKLQPISTDKHLVELPTIYTSPEEAIDLFVHHLILTLSYFEAVPHDAHNLIADKIRNKWTGLGTESAIKLYFNLEKEYNG